MSEANKKLVLAYVDAFNRRDLDAACALFSPDAQIHGVLGHGGIDVARPIWQDLIDCHDMTLHVDAIIAEADTVAVRFTERGTSLKPFRNGPPATGKSYQITALEWFTIKNNQIHQRWGARDSATIQRQLGLTPA